LSTVTITATLVILLSERRKVTALPFLLGSVAGCAALVGLAALGFSTAPPSYPWTDEALAGLEVAIGLLLIALSVFSWKWARRPRPAKESKWLDRIGSIGPIQAFAVAFLLNLRPKGLLLSLTAGIVLRGHDLSLEADVAMIATYVALATSTVVIPIVLTLLFPPRMIPRLAEARDWISANGAVLTASIMFMVGVVITGLGLSSW